VVEDLIFMLLADNNSTVECARQLGNHAMSLFAEPSYWHRTTLAFSDEMSEDNLPQDLELLRELGTAEATAIRFLEKSKATLTAAPCANSHDAAEETQAFLERKYLKLAEIGAKIGQRLLLRSAVMAESDAPANSSIVGCCGGCSGSSNSGGSSNVIGGKSSSSSSSSSGGCCCSSSCGCGCMGTSSHDMVSDGGAISGGNRNSLAMSGNSGAHTVGAGCAHEVPSDSVVGPTAAVNAVCGMASEEAGSKSMLMRMQALLGHVKRKASELEGEMVCDSLAGLSITPHWERKAFKRQDGTAVFTPRAPTSVCSSDRPVREIGSRQGMQESFQNDTSPTAASDLGDSGLSSRQDTTTGSTSHDEPSTYTYSSTDVWHPSWSERGSRSSWPAANCDSLLPNAGVNEASSTAERLETLLRKVKRKAAELEEEVVVGCLSELSINHLQIASPEEPTESEQDSRCCDIGCANPRSRPRITCQ